MEATRRDFIKTGVAATAVAGSVGVAAAEDVEAVIASTQFIDIHAHCSEFELPPVYAKG